MHTTYWLVVLFSISSVQTFSSDEFDYQALEIVNGFDTQPDDFKYVVGINCNPYRCRCTGSIIDKRYVISAAHCFLDKDLNFGFYPIRIVAGSNDIGDYKDPRRIEMNVEKIYVPGGFNHSYKDDISVLKLRKNLHLRQNNLQNLHLPAKTQSRFAGKQTVFLGFGVTKITYTVSKNKTVEEFNHPNSELHSANVLVEANDKCNDKLIVNSNLCGKIIKDKLAKHYGGCSGDSGGPLVYKSKVLIGVFIRGPPTCNERFESGVYTRVQSHIEFIKNAMKDNTTGMLFKDY